MDINVTDRFERIIMDYTFDVLAHVATGEIDIRQPGFSDQLKEGSLVTDTVNSLFEVVDDAVDEYMTELLREVRVPEFRLK